MSRAVWYVSLVFGSCTKEKRPRPSVVIRIPVKQETESVAVHARQKAALELWDELRENGAAKWEIVYCQAGVLAGVRAISLTSKQADCVGF